MQKHNIAGAGLDDVARELTGREEIVMGIRPRGYHAGNMTSLVAYPLMLGAAVEIYQGTTARFSYHCWLNDIEQDRSVGADGRERSADPVNSYPADKTIQFTPGPSGFKGKLVDYWQPLIEKSVNLLHRFFPNTNVKFHRTSEMKTTDAFAKTVIGALSSKDLVAGIIGEELGMRVKRPAEFVRAVCPACEVPVANTRLVSRYKVQIDCPNDGFSSTRAVADFDWWMPFRLLNVARNQLTPGDLRIMGIDHLPENTTEVASRLTRAFGMQPKENTFLYAPLLLSYDGRKMGKSNGNVVYALPKDLVLLLAEEAGQEVSMRGVPSSKNIHFLGDIVPDHMGKPSFGDKREIVRDLRERAIEAALEDVAALLGGRPGRGVRPLNPRGNPHG